MGADDGRFVDGAPETYKDGLDNRFAALKAAIDATDIRYRDRPVAQLLGHLRWSRPNQLVRWHAGTTASVPETAANLSIDVGTPLPDAMAIVLAALREELSGAALASLDAYRQAVHDFHAQQQGPSSVTGAGPAITEAQETARARRGGMAYVAPSRTETPEAESSIFVRDPDVIDRGTSAHKDIQEAIAGRIRDQGLEPVSPDRDDPKFDIAWVDRGTLYLCEVKSLTQANEETQLRLGLGQLLSYLYRTHVEDWPGAMKIKGVLAVEGPPTTTDWLEICAENGVILTWPNCLADLFETERGAEVPTTDSFG